MMLSVVKKGILRNTWSNPVIFCSLRTQSKKKNVEDLQFDNVIEATGPHNHVNFVHQRRKMMPDRVKGFKKIVLRERDTEPVLYPTLEQRLIGKSYSQHHDEIIFTKSCFQSMKFTLW